MTKTKAKEYRISVSVFDPAEGGVDSEKTWINGFNKTAILPIGDGIDFTMSKDGKPWKRVMIALSEATSKNGGK